MSSRTTKSAHNALTDHGELIRQLRADLADAAPITYGRREVEWASLTRCLRAGLEDGASSAEFIQQVGEVWVAVPHGGGVGGFSSALRQVLAGAR